MQSALSRADDITLSGSRCELGASYDPSMNSCYRTRYRICRPLLGSLDKTDGQGELVAQILVGALQPGSRPIGIGLNGARRGVAMFSGVPRGVVVKPCTPVELAAECFCTLLANALNVQAPECAIVYENNVPYFGSIDLQAPNLVQQFCIDPSSPNDAELKALVDELAQWIGIGRLIALDILIRNADRHPGNLLTDGSDYWAIDHGRSLGLWPYAGHKSYRLITMYADPLTCANIEAGAVSNALTFPIGCESKSQHELNAHALLSAHAQPFAQMVACHLPSLAASIKGLL